MILIFNIFRKAVDTRYILHTLILQLKGNVLKNTETKNMLFDDITFFFITAEGLNQKWSCFNIGNKLFADFFQKKIFPWLSQWNFFPCKVLAKSQLPNELLISSKWGSAMQKCQNETKAVLKLFLLNFSTILKLSSNAKKKLLRSIFWKSLVSLLGSTLLQQKIGLLIQFLVWVGSKVLVD